MLQLHFQRHILSIVVLLVFAVAAEPISCALAQESQTTKSTLTEQGLAFYRAGDNKQAAESFRKATKENGENSTAWHYLGLSLVRRGARKEAGTALKTAANLRLAQISSMLGSHGSLHGSQLSVLCDEAKLSVEEYLNGSSFQFLRLRVT